MRSISTWPTARSKTVEGQKTRLEYELPEAYPAPSYLQIRRNYGAAIKNLGGEILYDEGEYVSGKVVKNGKEAWVGIKAYNGGNGYVLTILEVEAMVQEVTAGEMLNALNRDGFIALYINSTPARPTSSPSPRRRSPRS